MGRHRKSDQQFNCVEQLLVIRNHINKMLQQSMSNTEISLREWELLTYLSKHRIVFANEMAQEFGVTRTLVSKNIWKLIRRDLAHSQVDPKDRRNIKLSITWAGQSELRTITKQVYQNLSNFEQTKELTLLKQQVSLLEQQLDQIKIQLHP